MSQYKVLVVEDEPYIAESLLEMLEILTHEVVEVVASYDDAIEVLEQEKVDIALLDIQLHGFKSGIDIAEYMREKTNVPFIFTTAFADRDFIQKASVHGPYGYVVKPYGIKDIDAAIEIAIQNHTKFKKLKEGYGGILNNESLFARVNSRIVRIALEDLLFAEAKGDYVIFRTEKRGYVVQTTFKSAEEKLDPSRFVKVHRSYIVNLDKVIDLQDNSLHVGNQIVPVARSRKATLLEKLDPI